MTKKVLLVDDHDLIRQGLRRAFERSEDFSVVGEAASIGEGLALATQLEPDVVLMDIRLPDGNGLDAVKRLRAARPEVGIVVLTMYAGDEHLFGALEAGASAFVPKDAPAEDVVAAARHAAASPDAFSAADLANAIEARDSYLHGHCERLASLAVRIAEDLDIAPEEIETVRLGAILHDVGKIGIPDRVLLKPGLLDDEERRIIETHTEIGDKLLEPLDLLAGARPIVRHHHERWDGGGYPDGLAREQIPVGARIVAVADSVEAMTSRQLYRKPLEPDEIIAELQKHRGKQWAPDVVDVVLRLIASGELVLAQGGLRLLEPAP